MIDDPCNAADLAERFESALCNLARGWRHAADRRLKNIGMSRATWMTIAAASKATSPVSQSKLADILATSNPAMVHVIDRLANAGLVIRERSVADRRVNSIVITDAGHRLYAELKNEAAAVGEQLLAGIELQSLARLTELLEHLRFTWVGQGSKRPGSRPSRSKPAGRQAFPHPGPE
jgi:MarR family transcriptional regulator, transcriptional regulator for hemolysin